VTLSPGGPGSDGVDELDTSLTRNVYEGPQRSGPSSGKPFLNSLTFDEDVGLKQSIGFTAEYAGDDFHGLSHAGTQKFFVRLRIGSGRWWADQ
jgi:hypothetical protein